MPDDRVERSADGPGDRETEIGKPENPETLETRETLEAPKSRVDPFDGLVLDDEFIRGGSYEPPARTRQAIAQFGDQQTSWRHGGGLRRHHSHSQGHSRADNRRASDQRGSRSARPPGSQPHPWVSRLPILVTIAVVAAVLLMYY